MVTWLGEEKIPDPIMSPTINERPLRYVSDLCLSRETPLRSKGPDVGVPSAEYPGAVEERGNRLEANSNADETEYERVWGVGRGVRAGLKTEVGPSLAGDCLREEEMPDGEEDPDLRDDVCEVDAREASSKESRGGWVEGALRFP